MRTIFSGIIVLFGLLAVTSTGSAAEPRPRALILASDRPMADLMRRVLTEHGKFDVTVNETAAGATEQLFLPYELVVLSDVLGDTQPIHQYVNHGKGLLLVGRGAVNAWMGPGKNKPEKDAEIIATAPNQEPVAWKSTSGKGRVFCLTLGNDLPAMYEDGFADLFVRGALWSASGKEGAVAHVDLFRSKTNAVRVLVITGGHAYPTSFYSLFDGYDDITWTHATSMLEALKSDLRPRYDMLVLYDGYRGMLPDPERNNLLDFLESGRGVLILHHAISDFNAWDWWQREVQGAKYFFTAEDATPASSYKHDLDLHLIPTEQHPITRGIGPFRLVDEVYYGMRYSPNIRVLVKMESPLKETPVVWVGPYAKARVVYMLPGHDEHAHLHPVYRTLVHNAILWISHRLD